jgi:hypothetical protein
MPKCAKSTLIYIELKNLLTNSREKEKEEEEEEEEDEKQATSCREILSFSLIQL